MAYIIMYLYYIILLSVQHQHTETDNIKKRLKMNIIIVNMRSLDSPFDVQCTDKFLHFMILCV